MKKAEIFRLKMLSNHNFDGESFKLDAVVDFG